MRIAVDLDGTISADPAFFRRMLRDWMEGDDQVFILTGNPEGDKELAQLGFIKGRDYTSCVVVPRRKIARFKLEFMRQAGISHLIDNRDKTVKKIQKAGLTALHYMAPDAKSER